VYPLETVHAPFDAYGSKQIKLQKKKKKKNQCIDSSPLSFLITDSFCLLTKGFFLFNRYFSYSIDTSFDYFDYITYIYI